MDLGLKGKVALVTGGGSQKGFGRGICLTLAREGCNVIITDVDLEGAKKTADEIVALGGQAFAVQADISKEEEVEKMVQAGVERYGPIDILVNNAGRISQLKLFADKTKTDCDTDIQLNYVGPMNCVRAVVKSMIDRKYGKIINISSIGANKAAPTSAVYNGCKAAIIGFSKSLAADLGPHNINVNCIAPGMGLTNLCGGPPPEEKLNAFLASVPSRRTVTPQDIGSAVAFLASDVSSNIMGQNIGVDGGQSSI